MKGNSKYTIGLHFSYHKCLTVYFQRVMRFLFEPKTLNKISKHLGFKKKSGYKHFKSFKQDFLAEFGDYKFASLNNHKIDVEKISGIPISHFVRDPRDLIVSGYFYHKSGIENWTLIKSPTQDDYQIVNGILPDNMPKHISLYEYLNSCSLEDGLMAEIQFRKEHFRNMLAWPGEATNFIEFRYEDILGNELEVFDQLFKHYEFGKDLIVRGIKGCEKYSAQKQQGKLEHIRDPKPNQYMEIMPEKVLEYFNFHYDELLEKYDYK